MEFLHKPMVIERRLLRNLKRCTSTRWAVAWASSVAPSFSDLLKHDKKIDQLTVGIHFYQTDPAFIEAFAEHPKAQFVMNPSGVFHPKLYYFEFGDGGQARS